MESSPQVLWERCLQIIKENVTEQQYKTWFTPIICTSYEQETVTVQVPSQFVYEYLEEHYVNLLRRVLNRVFGAGTKLLYRVEADKTNNITVDLEASPRPVAAAAPRPVTNANKAPNVLQAPMPQDLDP